MMPTDFSLPDTLQRRTRTNQNFGQHYRTEYADGKIILSVYWPGGQSVGKRIYDSLEKMLSDYPWSDEQVIDVVRVWQAGRLNLVQ